MLHFPDPSKLKTRKLVFEDVFAVHDSGTLEQLKELSSKRRVIEETINETSAITEAIAREMFGGLTSQSLQDLQKLRQYLPLLENLVFHVDAARGNNRMARWISNLKIQWSSALSGSSFLNLMGPKFFQVDNIRFELGMSLYLYGAILRNRASEIIPTDLVQSATIFREAAGVHKYLSMEVLPHLESIPYGQRPPEATTSLNAAMSLICLAEAQALTIRKAEERKTTAGLLAKLHHGVTEFLHEASTILFAGPREIKDSSSSLLEYLSSCTALHELKSLKYLAEDLKAASQVGVAIGVLRQALINVRKKLPAVEPWRNVIMKEINEAAESLRKFENENEFVWHEKIASGDELPVPQGSKIATIIQYQPTRHEWQLFFKI